MGVETAVTHSHLCRWATDIEKERKRKRPRRRKK